MNKPMMKISAAAVLAAFALVGCDRPETSARTSADTSSSRDIASQTEQQSREVGADASKGMAEVKEASREVVQDVKEASKTVGNEVSNKVSDAVITSSVKAELVKDPNLSALKVNVDTDAGRVLLKGSAPSTGARDQAMRLAQAVKGVVSVDNQLVVEPGKG